MPGPQGCVGGGLWVITRGMAVGGRFRGASGTPPPTGCPETGDSGRSRRGGGTPPYVWGDMETLWGLRGQSFPGRRAVGAGHARPGGLRGHPSMVRPVGRGLDPSAGCWRQRKSPRVATRGRAAAQAFAGRRGRRPLRFARERAVTEGRGGVGHPALRMGIWKHCRVDTGSCSRAAVPEPPCGRGRACPARGVTWAEVCGSVCREGS